MKKILIICFVLSVTATSCLKDILCINGNGTLETQSRNTSAFNNIENSTVADVIYKKADSASISIVAESNLLGHIFTETVNGKLEIRTEPQNACLDYNIQPVITVTSTELKNIELSGSGALTADTMSGNPNVIKLSGSGDMFIGDISCNDLSVTLYGSGNIEITRGSLQDADILITGSGDINIKGHSSSGHLRVTGSGNINSGQFTLGTANVTISGSGNIFTWVENSLTAAISGSGNIYLKGSPTINQTITGSGKIIKY
jgi:hypothetical protein